MTCKSKFKGPNQIRQITVEETSFHKVQKHLINRNFFDFCVCPIVAKLRFHFLTDCFEVPFKFFAGTKQNLE